MYLLKLSVALILTTIVSVGCAELAGLETKYPVGSAVNSPFSIANKQVPLPEGKWVVASQETGSSSLGSRDGGIILVNEEANGRAIMVEIRTNLAASESRVGWTPLTTCARKDLLSPSPTNTYTAGAEECWFISHMSITRSDKTSVLRTKALDFIQSRNIAVPLTSIYVGYRVADKLDYLTVRYLFNPEAEGFAPPKRAVWGSNDWHRDLIGADPKKVAYVGNLKTWGAGWLGKIKTGFDGKLPAAALALIPQNSNPLSSDVAARLAKLRGLLDKNLITPEEYKTRRKKILDGI